MISEGGKGSKGRGVLIVKMVVGVVRVIKHV